MPSNAYLVLGVNPVSNESNVELSTTISITFAKHINLDTLNNNTIRLRKVNGDFVEYTGRYNNVNKVYEITPNAPLEPNTQYQTMVMGGTSGVVSIDNNYLPSTKTYEFVTVQKKGITALENLVLAQDYYFVSAKWDLPNGLVDGEEIYFNVRLSTSNNPEAYDLWPKNPLEGKTTSLSFTIPYRLEAEKNYYVHVQGVTGDKETAWLTSQIYIEKKGEQPVTPPVVEPPTTGEGGGSGGEGAIVGQLSIVDHFPQTGELQKPSEVVVVFTDTIASSLFGEEQPETNPLFYVVEAPYKQQLSLIDMRGAYSPNKAIKGRISLDEENANVLVFTPAEGPTVFRQGKEYTVVVSKNLKGENTLPTGMTYTFSFVGTPEHLHGDITQIREVLKQFGLNPSTRFLQSLMRKYSQFACDIWFESPAFDEELHKDGDAPYYINEYVNTQVTIDSLLSGGSAVSSSGDESIKLGDLSVTKKAGSSSSNNVSSMIKKLQGALKPWEDLIHGHHNRGYAKPGNAVKGESVSPYPDFVTRTTLKDFDK
ncbi:Ig-like domain-containing protein [Bacillus cereus group sp. TH204-1LC]|uniref:Ig-like domain-containing protein n=1 Tax=Bacillus cereus group sp. TH204-1LC TaxID=3018054 RepID=UPI0022E50F65|nr:Ig-like domain-containing protein [Bacillus cereus group sp. TH204-1LC]MDA1616342.1 Ig-like domain-containing protein [Bacillus cereus group sp. TH204-1LC]